MYINSLFTEIKTATRLDANGYPYKVDTIEPIYKRKNIGQLWAEFRKMIKETDQQAEYTGQGNRLNYNGDKYIANEERKLLNNG